MTDTPSAPASSPLQAATMDMARSVLMGIGTPILAHGYVTGKQEEAIIGGLIAVGSAAWSYIAKHPSRTPPLQTILGLVRQGGRQGAWNGDVGQLEAALLPVVEKLVDQQIKSRAGVLSGPLDGAANAAIKAGAEQTAEHLRII
jgi:hypothetical protein